MDSDSKMNPGAVSTFIEKVMGFNKININPGLDLVEEVEEKYSKYVNVLAFVSPDPW
jgi:hypothetical protein